jgi:hypothetical protein
VKQNELTPGIPSEEYERRRSRLMESLPDNSIAVSVSAPIQYMSESEQAFVLTIHEFNLKYIEILFVHLSRLLSFRSLHSF